MKAGGIGRMGNVTKLLQRQRRDSQWRMQDFVSVRAFPPFSEEEPSGSEVSGYHTREILEISRVVIAVEQLPRRRRRKKFDASTSQSNNFGVSRKRFKPSTPGSSYELGRCQTRNKVEQLYRSTLLGDKVACLTSQVAQLLTSRATNLSVRNHLYSSAISRSVAELRLVNCLFTHELLILM